MPTLSRAHTLQVFIPRASVTWQRPLAPPSASVGLDGEGQEPHCRRTTAASDLLQPLPQSIDASPQPPFSPVPRTTSSSNFNHHVLLFIGMNPFLTSSIMLSSYRYLLPCMWTQRPCMGMGVGGENPPPCRDGVWNE